jgi:hypothetical protein
MPDKSKLSQSTNQKERKLTAADALNLGDFVLKVGDSVLHPSRVGHLEVVGFEHGFVLCQQYNGDWTGKFPPEELDLVIEAPEWNMIFAQSLVPGPRAYPEAEKRASLKGNIDRAIDALRQLRDGPPLPLPANEAALTASLLPGMAHVALDDKDVQILWALARSSPRALLQQEIECDSEVSRTTIRNRMPTLIRAGFVEQKGERKGATITQRGKEQLDHIKGTTRGAQLFARLEQYLVTRNGYAH